MQTYGEDVELRVVDPNTESRFVVGLYRLVCVVRVRSSQALVLRVVRDPKGMLPLATIYQLGDDALIDEGQTGRQPLRVVVLLVGLRAKPTASMIGSQPHKIEVMPASLS